MQVRISRDAGQDMHAIYNYIAKQLFNEDAALRLIRKFDEAFSRLGELPYVHSPVKTPKLKDKGYRKIIIDNYIAFYKIEQETVVIYRIIYGASNYDDIL